MIKSYKFRLKPKRKVYKKLLLQLAIAEELYNEILKESVERYKKDSSFRINKKNLNMILKEIKAKDPKYLKLYSQVEQDIFIRIQRAYQGFFRRIRNREKAGFPREKRYYKSITYPQNNGSFIIRKNKLKVSKIGTIKIILHRKIEGTLKTMTIKRDRLGRFYAFFTAIQKDDGKQQKREERGVGIDVGLDHLMTLSDGTHIENPRFLKQSEGRLAFLQRKVSRKSKGSRNRRKSVGRVAMLHQKVFNQRNDYLHKLTANLASTFTTFAIEDLNERNMLQNHRFAKSISDASWNRFVQLLSYKAESANLRVIAVDPRNTSMTCSNCDIMKDMPLSERLYKCDSCRFEADRDVNAALNILKRATMGHMGSNACGDAAAEALSKKQELNPGNTGGSLGL